MIKNPFCVDKNALASDVLTQMNKKKLQMYVFTVVKINKKL